MAANEIRVGDINTVFEATIQEDAVALDISAATTKDLIFVNPNGTKLTKAATFKTTGADGVIIYTTVANDLDVDGVWRLQGLIVLGAGTHRTDIVSFTVHPNL